MPASPLVAVLSAGFFAASFAAAPDPCQLVTVAEITAALGSAPSAGNSSGPNRDETGAALTSCTRTVGKMVLDISVGEFSDPAAADRAVSLLPKTEPDDEDEARLLPATGVGDRSLFGATKIGAHWFFQKGKHTVSVTLAGALGDGAKYRESLKKLAIAALGRL